MTNLPRHGKTESTRRVSQTLERYVAPLYGAWRTPGRRFLEIRPLIDGTSKIQVVAYK